MKILVIKSLNKAYKECTKISNTLLCPNGVNDVEFKTNWVRSYFIAFAYKQVCISLSKKTKRHLFLINEDLYKKLDLNENINFYNAYMNKEFNRIAKYYATLFIKH